MLLTVGRSYVGNDVTHSTLLDRACACSYENLPKYRSYRGVAGWLASRTLDPRVVSSNPGRSVTCGCVPGQNTLPLIARVFSDRTLKIVGPFYLVSMPGEVKDPTRVINNVTRSGLTNSSISGAIGYGRVVRTTDCGRRCCMTQTWARTLCDITPSDV